MVFAEWTGFADAHPIITAIAMFTVFLGVGAIAHSKIERVS
jgi:hypothetical protein